MGTDMPRAQRPRKRYVPKPVRTDAHLHAIDRVATLLDTQRQDLLGPLLEGFEAFRTGHGTARAWCTLADALNVGEVLTELQIGSNLRAHFAMAQAALAAVHARQKAGGSWTLRGPEIAVLDDAVWAAKVQLEYCSQGELADAVNTVKRRAAGALAGNVGADTTVCVGHLGRDLEAA
jgi:hypothetical protein